MSVLRLGRRAMGTFFEVLVHGEDPTHLRAAAEAALDEIDRLEAQLSVYLPTSEVSRINRLASERAVALDPDLATLLGRAQTLWRETNGAFDVTVAPWMEAYGFRGDGSRRLREAKRRAGMQHVVLRDGAIRFLREGVALDLGGIGKGHALDRAADVLRAHGVESAFLHGGTSTIYALGAPPGEDGWPVGLVDPREPDRRLGSLVLRDQAFSTSSGLGRVVERAGRVVGHVLDPRTGVPAERACAWALAPAAADTDALSTAFLLEGAAAVASYVDAHVGVGAMLLDEELVCFGVEPALHPEARTVSGVSRRVLLQGAAAAAAAFAVGLPTTRAVAEDAPAKTLRVAVVGVGEHGRLLLAQLARMPAVQVVAVCDIDPKARAAGVTLAGRSVETYEDHEHLVDEEEPDALVVATPTHRHADIVVHALENGVPVFVEAPLARTVEDCKRIARAAKESGLVCRVDHQRRSSKLYPHALTHIGSGAIGKILQIRAQWNQKRSWRRSGHPRKDDPLVNWRLYREASGGLLLEQGSHVFDLATWYLAELPEAVTGFGALTSWKDGREVDDSVQVIVRYPGGVQLSYGASLVSSYGDDRELIVGDAASILLMRQHKGLLFKEADTVAAGWEQYAKTEMLGTARGILLDAEATKYKTHEKPEQVGPDADKADYFTALERFLTSVRGRETEGCDAYAGMVAAVTALAAEEAIRTKRVVELTRDDFEV